MLTCCRSKLFMGQLVGSKQAKKQCNPRVGYPVYWFVLHFAQTAAETETSVP